MTHCAPSLFCLSPPLTDVIAAPGHSGAALGFSTALAVQGFNSGPSEKARAILWVRHEAAMAEIGALYGSGLAAFGLDPSRLILAQLRTPRDVLRAGLEGARCAALAAVIIETMAVIDFTASRRLKLAATQSGVPVILLRHGDTNTHASAPTAASVRWQVNGTPSEINTPTFDVTILKHPYTFPGQRHVIAWDQQHRAFIETLSVPVAAISDGRSLAA